eukprot:361347-Chlamydomonas_euryale.AAC.1
MADAICRGCIVHALHAPCAPHGRLAHACACQMTYASVCAARHSPPAAHGECASACLHPCMTNGFYMLPSMHGECASACFHPCMASVLLHASTHACMRVGRHASRQAGIACRMPPFAANNMHTCMHACMRGRCMPVSPHAPPMQAAACMRGTCYMLRR